MTAPVQNLNQFAQLPEKGAVAAIPTPNTFSAVVDPNSVATLVAGDAVKLTSSTGNAILVDKCAVTDDPIGFVAYVIKGNSYTANMGLEIVTNGSIMNAQASGSITRSNSLEFVASGSYMKASAGVNPVSAIALDNATDGSVFRMLIIVPVSPAGTTGAATISSGSINGTIIGGNTPAAATFTTVNINSTLTGPDGGFGIYSKRTPVTIAQLNAGYTLLAAVTGRKIRMVGCKIISYGGNMAATANATGVAISATQTAAPVALFTVNLAQLTRSTLNSPGTASTVILADGASFADNDAATAITIAAVGGTDLITATGVEVEITYTIE